MKIKLNDLSQRAYEIAKANGFHDKQTPVIVDLMMIITELSEMVQADRKNQRSVGKGSVIVKVWKDNQDVSVNGLYHDLLKGTVEEELADVVIRFLDFAGSRNIPLEIDTERKYVGNIDFTAFTVAEWAMPIVMAISESVAGYYSVSSEFIESMIEACFKYAEAYQIPLLDIVGIKMKYNETRGHLHGCKY